MKEALTGMLASGIQGHGKQAEPLCSDNCITMRCGQAFSLDNIAPVVD